MKNPKGFTLLEVVFVMTLVVLLVSSIMFLYVVVLRSWDQFGRRSDMRSKIQFALERMTRDVRKANAISVSNNELRITIYECSPSCANNSYVYYLYNTSELRRTTLSGGIGGTFASGSGDLMATGLTNATTLTISGNVANMNLVGSDSNETLRVQGYARPRNK